WASSFASLGGASCGIVRSTDGASVGSNMGVGSLSAGTCAGMDDSAAIGPSDAAGTGACTAAGAAMATVSTVAAGNAGAATLGCAADSTGAGEGCAIATCWIVIVAARVGEETRATSAVGVTA